MKMENWQIMQYERESGLSNSISLPIPDKRHSVQPEPERDWFGAELEERETYWYDKFDWVPDDLVEDYVNQKWEDVSGIESYEKAIDILEGQGFDLVDYEGNKL